MQTYFTGKTVLVTGASSGIGEAIVRLLAPMQTRLLLAARSKDRLDALAGAVRAEGSEAVVLPVDLSDPEAVRALADAVLESGHRVDVLVNNAGVGHFGTFETQDEGRLAQMLRLNVEALTLLTHRLWTQFPRGGGVLNVASTAAFQPIPHMAAYAASKAYVLSLSEALHAEGAARGIRVTALCPGATDTGFAYAAGAEGHGLFRMAMEAEEVARKGLAAFAEGERVAVTGGANAAAAFMSRLTPNALLVPTMARVFARLQRSAEGASKD